MAARGAVMPTGTRGAPVRPCIAILLGAPMNAQNVERTGIPYLSPYAHIVVFDCKPWLGRSDNGLHHERAGWEHIEAIASAEAFEKALQRHQPDYALDFIGLGALTPLLQALLANAGTRFVVQKSGSLPIPSPWSRLAWKLKARRQLPAFATVTEAGSCITPDGNMLSRLSDRLISAWKLRRSLLSPDLALLAGSASLNHFTGRARHILWVGSQDYHIYHRLPVVSKDGLPEAPYAVFIDDNLPYASDWSLLGLPAPVTPQRYYPAMQRLLDAVETRWGMPVVVASHPSSRHDERVQQGFHGRRLIHGRTAELVRNAHAVLLHGSTAVSFAVLANKPMLFLGSDELSTCSYGLHVNTMASELGHVPLNIDSHTSLPAPNGLAPNPAIYSRYADRYLCRRGSSESQPWQAFIDYMLAQAPIQSRSEANLGLA